MDRSADILKSLAGIQLTLLAIVLRFVGSNDGTLSLLVGLVGLALCLVAWAGPSRARSSTLVEPAPSAAHASAADAE